MKVQPYLTLPKTVLERSMSDALADPGKDPGEIRVLDPEIHEEDLKRLYGKMSMHMAQLLFQHNDLVDSEDDCRNKYVARYLFHLLAKKGHLSAFGFLEDNWPQNILLDHHDNIVAALDWEFAYSAPTQFSLDPPWWLLLQLPELWPSGIDDWSQVYEARLRTWLLAMEDEEWGEGINFPANLSTYLRESWLSGRFWLGYAMRKSWAFDTIFRKYPG
ncbi:hypothetical protein FOC1_g10008348 [Fusarium oxysporum f. sp. cubense race 1]|uniref:Aminoglycoside phosphotransferase domain-containing protein n=1 Tax=Fusarium oxysporum f. sp. cubense (strain race 1) TaxID=1229664 RepID=N4UI08_FUSC1|nr:hypothetical protein FOC1_g10008348 [Fusarium oxysporum f. sp. cubense race 1]